MSDMAQRGDRAAITQVVNDWGLYRDTARWTKLRPLYARDAEMVTTWFVGDADGFIERSTAAAAKRAMQVQHFIGACSIELNGDRAIAETRMILMLRGMFGDIPVDVTCHGRFHDRFVREDGMWCIKRRVPVYEKDRIDPVEPGRALNLDYAVLERFEHGYRHVAYLQALGGATLTPGLPTPGNAAEASLYAEADAWLHASANGLPGLNT
jgi:hypothetical protein